MQVGKAVVTVLAIAFTIYLVVVMTAYDMEVYHRKYPGTTSSDYWWDLFANGGK